MLPVDAAVPEELVHERFIVTPLTSALAALDHDAYVSSPEVIRAHSAGRWPVEGFTLERNLELVARHESDHQSRRAFAFVLLNTDRTASLGCVYLNPLADYLRRVGADRASLDRVPAGSAMVTLWLRQGSEHLTATVVAAIDAWVARSWPLTTYLFRALPAERATIAALEGMDLRRVAIRVVGEPSYVWFEPEVVRRGRQA